MLRRSLHRMRVFIPAAVLLAAAGLGLLLPPRASRADVGELPEPGGLVTPGDKTAAVRMASENVLFVVRPDDGTFAEERGEYYAHVTAEFVMRNLTGGPVAMDLFFPFHSGLGLAGFQDPASARMRQAKNVSVTVNGAEVEVSYADLALASQETVVAAVFPVTFAAGSDTTIRIEYDLRAVHEPKSPLLSFKYLMETGSHWAGTIGSGTVSFAFWIPVTDKESFGRVNDFFRVSEGRLQWDFAELEPDPSHNITVTFDPARLAGQEAPQRDAPQPSTLSAALTVRAFIDGRSRLIVRGDAVSWHHLDFAAPGRWMDPARGLEFDEPTYLNGVAWRPVWPDQPHRENRDCNCDSNSTVGVPPLSRRVQTAGLDVMQGRGQVTIVEQPNARNDYTLIVEFDDNPQDGADWYEVVLHYVSSMIVARGQTVTTPQGTPADIVLSGWDPDGKPVTFEVVDGPSHGVLSGVAPSLIYLPDPGYAGADAFTYRAGSEGRASQEAEVKLIVGLPSEIRWECTGPNLLQNGDFEAGFDDHGVGLGWGSFHSGEGAEYSFVAETWQPAVHQGAHSQLIAIRSADHAPAADRVAGISQTVAGMEPGAVYELSLAGMMREEAAHPGEDPYRYRVQWAYTSQEHRDWARTAGWQELPWDEIHLQADPGAFSTHATHLVAPSQPLTLFIRAWKKWATAGRELDLDLDGIALRRCTPQAPVPGR